MPGNGCERVRQGKRDERRAEGEDEKSTEYIDQSFCVWFSLMQNNNNEKKFKEGNNATESCKTDYLTHVSYS